jgi:hypothetical protein
MEEATLASGTPPRRRPGRLVIRARRILLGRRVKPFWRHCLLAFPLATIPASVLILLGAAVLEVLGVDLSKHSPPELGLGAGDILGAVLAAPLLETALLTVGLAILSVFTRRKVIAAAVSAVLWGLLHGLIAPFWFLGAVWPFYVFSLCYLAWQPRSFGHGYTVALVPHVLNNAFAVAMVALERLA